MAIFRKDDVTIRFGGDDSAFQKAANRVKKTGNEIAGSMGKAGKAISDLFGGFKTGIAAGVTAVAAAFTALAKSSLEAADSLAKTSDKIGVSIEDLQELRYAASTVGVEEQQLDTALQRFSRRLGEAAQGTGVLHKELQRLGIPLRNADGSARRITDVLGDYADAVMRADSAQEQLRLTVAAFDTEGAGLVNLLREGAEGMAGMQQAAHDLGLVLDEQMVRKAEIVNQAWDDFFSRMSVKLKSFALSVVNLFSGIDLEARNVEQAQALIAEKTEELIKKQKRLETATLSGAARLSLQRSIKILKEEIQVLEEKEKKLQALVKVQDKLNRTQQEGAKTSLAAAEGASQIVQDALKAAEEAAKKAEAAQAVVPTQTDILRAALADFQAGKITATQLGIIQGIQPFVQPVAGAYGTQGNLLRGAPDTGRIIEQPGAVPTFTTSADIERQRQFEMLNVTAGAPEFGDSLQRDLDSRVFIARVRPVLVDDSNPIEHIIDQVGGKD